MTNNIINYLEGGVILHLNIAKEKYETNFGYIIRTFPSILFIMLSRYTNWIWLEFLLRASPWLLFKCLWTRWWFKPDVVIFNHHSSFLYIPLFIGNKRMLVWHDVPSFKRDSKINLKNSARACSLMERFYLSSSDLNITLSFSDKKFLKRMHKSHSIILPVIDIKPKRRKCSSSVGQWLMIGNWTRFENCEGAKEFLYACCDLYERDPESVLENIAINLAGYGSSEFVISLMQKKPKLSKLNIRATPRYASIDDFNEFALIAPILRGAGIKIKTIEAWAADIPVIGTTQAFSGLPVDVWRIGGIRVSSIYELARLCINKFDFSELSSNIANLNGFEAYIAYQSAAHGHEFHNSRNSFYE